MKHILGLLMALTLSQMAFAKNGKKYPWLENLSTSAVATGPNACSDAQHIAAVKLIKMAQKYCAQSGLQLFQEQEYDDSEYSSYIPTSGNGYQIYVDFDHMRCTSPRTSLTATIHFDCFR